MKTLPFVMLFVFLSLSFSLHAQQSQPSQTDLDTAAKRFEEAKVFYNIHEYEKALEGFKESYLLSKEPVLLINIGQCYRFLERYDDAIRTYRAFLDEVPDSESRADIEKTIAEIEARKPTLTKETTSLKVFSAQDPAKVFLDGEEKGLSPLILEGLSPGEHILEVRKEGFVSYEEKLMLESNQRAIVKAQLSPSSLVKPKETLNPKIPKRFVEVAAVSGGLSVLSGVFALALAQKSKTLHQAGESSFEEVNAPREAAISVGNFSSILLGVAVVSWGVGRVLKRRVVQPEVSRVVTPKEGALYVSF